ncbi:MAG: dephospho-CoA kinase [Firmicutes bacterium]|nr:dephospho-CoA kinase [Bacillota bacterium]
MRGLTGSIATGKSTVAKILRQHGAVVIDSDQIAKEVIEPGTDGWIEVKKHFPEVIGLDQKVNRKKLAEIIFDNIKRRRLLEGIIHPLVITRIKAEGRYLENLGKIVFVDMPLLYETNSQLWLEEVWVVYIPLKLQLQRLMIRDNLSESEALKRINAQISIEEKRKLADYVIDNSGSLDNTKEQVDKLWYQVIR